MTITLPREQQEWLEAQVAAPLVDEGLESLAQGGAITLEEHRCRIEEKLASLRRR